MTYDRYQIELGVLQNSTIKSKQYKFMDMDTPYPYLAVAIQTNSLRCYVVKIDLSDNYPYNIPKVFITSPKPLLTRSGGSMLQASHSMHTLTGENGCVRVCHYGYEDWAPNRTTLYQIIIKVRIWLEMYECHLKTGKTLDEFLKGANY